MCRSVLRFAVRCLAVFLFTSDTSKAEVSCTDDPGMCQLMSTNKDSAEDRRAYYPQSQQDLVSGEVPLDILSSPAFQSNLGSLSDSNVPLWLFMGLGLDKMPETVALYHGPSGFAVTLAPSQVNFNEDGTMIDIASGGNLQMQKASKQLSQTVAAGAQPTSRKKSAWQLQTQQQAAAWPQKTKAYNTFQSGALTPQRNYASGQTPQGVRQPQNSGKVKTFGLGFGNQVNSNTQLTAGVMVPSMGEQASSPNVWSSSASKMNQNKPTMPNQAVPYSLTFTKQPLTMQQYQTSLPVGPANNQKFGTVSIEQKQYLSQGAYKQGSKNTLQSTPPGAPVSRLGRGRYHFQQPQPQAAAAAIQTRPNVSPSKAASMPPAQLSGQPFQPGTAQSLLQDAQRQRNGAAKTTPPQQLLSPQQTLADGSTEASSKSTQALSTPQQQRGANTALNSTQGPIAPEQAAAPEQAGKGLTAAPTSAAKEEGTLAAGTPSTESIATTAAQTPATHKPLTEQQEALRKVGIMRR
uniref:Putative nucleolar gtpase/atpase n=1 Tax=Rhipicephalus microplus TaxID=6941 RepID=A0A6G5AAT2_RHIMP